MGFCCGFACIDDLPYPLLCQEIGCLAVRCGLPLCSCLFAQKSSDVRSSPVTLNMLFASLQRHAESRIARSVKWTILLWFLVGAYQFLSLKLGYPAEFTGRYVPDRSGVPSLSADPSFYGSLSVLQIMYLLSVRGRSSKFFLLLGLFSVFLSGSVLAMLLLIFPLAKITLSSRRGVPLLAGVLAITGIMFTFVDPPARIANLLSNGVNVSGFLLDTSTNLRAGHIYFTLFESQPESLLPVNPIDVQVQYNEFAARSPLFVETQTNYILSSLGELVYGSGLLALLLLGIILYRAQGECRLLSDKAIRVGFVLACLLNPIQISNVFLITYALKRE